jgi:hypothetical protein
MEMLEGRAHARSQIDQLEPALEDGNRMLTVDKTNPMVRFRNNASNHTGIYMLGIVIGVEEKTEIGSEVLCTRPQAMCGYTSETQRTSVAYSANSRLSSRLTKLLRKLFQTANL